MQAGRSSEFSPHTAWPRRSSSPSLATRQTKRRRPTLRTCARRRSATTRRSSSTRRSTRRSFRDLPRQPLASEGLLMRRPSVDALAPALSQRRRRCPRRRDRDSRPPIGHSSRPALKSSPPPPPGHVPPCPLSTGSSTYIHKSIKVTDTSTARWAKRNNTLSDSFFRCDFLFRF